MDMAQFNEIYNSEKFKKLISSGYFIDINDYESYVASIKNNKSAMPSESYWKDKRVLVTGAAGMVGSTIIDSLIDMGAKVYGAVKRHAVPYYPHFQHNLDTGKLKIFEVDLRDYSRVVGLVKELEPNVIFHQAAESFVPTGIQQPSHVVENNCVITVNLLEAITKEDKGIDGIQFACSSEQYGFVKSVDEIPVKETNELRPTSTYAATKVFTENIAKAYYYSYQTPAVITRSFNQEGPRRGAQFFTARVAMQVMDCLDGKSNKIIMGNPNSVRDFTHIHDSAKAQIMAVEKCNHGEAYNICSKKGISTGDYVRLAMKIFNLEDKTELLIDKTLLRSYERGEALFDGFIGDNTKFVEKTGWKPTKSVVDIIKDGVEYSRKME